MNIKPEKSNLKQNNLVYSLTTAHSHQLLEESNDTQTVDSQDLCIHQLFETQAEKTPDAVAVIFENQQLTYRQLNQRANQLAHHLRSLGVGPEVLVGICMERSLEMVVGLLGILKAGGAYVPLDPGYPSERLAFILEDTQATVMLTQAQLIQSLPAHQAQVVCLDSEWETIAQNSPENPICETTVDHLIYVIYTSGSTGQPKGVMISHRGICNQLYWRQTTFSLSETDRVLQSISFSFDPSVWQIFWPLCFGAQLILPRPGGQQDSAYLVKLIYEQQITVIALVPSMLRVVLEEKGIENCNCLRHISCGGEALPIELVERFFARLNLDNVLHNVYGPTEASIDATFWTCQRESDRSIAPIGRPITNAEIYILDSNLQPVPVGEAGELHIGGIGLARGYLNRPELTTEKFIPNPFSTEAGARLYKTGDLARYLPEGNIEFLGRIDHQVKIRGFRIELGEIEATLSQHSAVRETVVLTREDVPGDQRLVAYVVLNQEQAVTISDLRSFLKQKLAHYMVPSAFVVLDSLPLTPNGKVDRRALPAPDQARPELEREFVAPRDSVELQLTQIWEEILGIQPIGITDNFFDLGGHSLVALRLLAQIEQQFGKNLPISVLLRAPTIEDLAKIIHQEEPSALWQSLVAIQTDGDKPPLFCVSAADGNVIVFHNLVPYLGPQQPIYALQPEGLDGKPPVHTRLEDIAADYIKQIRTVQPQGPYYLSGYSSGGVVAFEMAQQLEAQGEKVALLALFDSTNPLYFKLSFLEWLYRGLSNFFRLKPKEQLGYLLRIPQQWFQKIAQKLNEDTPRSLVGKKSSPKANENEAAITTVVLTTKKAVKNYLMQVYPGRVVLFRSNKQAWWIASDIELGWSGLAAGGLEIQPVPGDHHSIVRADVQFLVEKLRDYIKLV